MSREAKRGPAAPAASSPANGVLRPEGWPRPGGYADGIAARGTLIFVSGQVGWDARTQVFGSADFNAQAAQALDNVIAIVAAAGAGPQHVVRLVWYIADLAAYRASRPALGKVFRERFGGHYPAMSVVQVAGLLEPGALLEIEATAVLPARI